MSLNTRKSKVALTGAVALELIATYFREAGYDVHGPDSPPLDEFAPDFIYDVTSHDAVLAAEVSGFFDARLAKLSGCPYSIDGIRAIVDEFGWEVLRSPRKVLAVDADNTLWRGILSEDGPDRLAAFADFQTGLADLARAGVILVILSKNDPGSLAAAPIDLSFFAAQCVNWSSKPGNLLNVCRELNVGVDSVVFVDDNPCERALMAEHLPEVAVAPFPDDLTRPAQFLRRLREYFFAASGATAEDRLRATDYRANQARANFARDLSCAGASSRATYLDALGLWVAPRLATVDDLDRLAQMAAKTNQFNATTIRRSREDFAAMLDDPRWRVFVFRAGDRFGEQGLVCYVVVDLSRERIADFVMSCRAMGRTLEHFAYAHVCSSLGYAPRVDFLPTAKNLPCAEFLASLPDGLETHYKEVR